MKKLRIVLPFISIIASVLLMVPVHELGHVLSSLMVGGKVINVSLVPASGYAAATTLDFSSVEMTFAKDLFVSVGGYLLTTIAAIILVIFSFKMRTSAVQFSVYMSALVFSLISFGQYIYVLVQTVIFSRNGIDTGSDMISTMYTYPGTESVCALVAFALLVLSVVNIICIAVRADSFSHFADIVIGAH